MQTSSCYMEKGGNGIMFCSKCGSRIPEGVAFCPKCGAIIGQNEQQGTGLQESEKTTFISKNGEMSTNEKEEFARFVDNHVRQTTKFQSAKELLNSKAPMRFAKISLVYPPYWELCCVL